MTSRAKAITGIGIAAALLGGLVAFAQDKDKPKEPAKPAAAGQDSERKVKEADVPKAALETMKKQAGGAAFTEFAEEIEHGHKFYEGSYKGPNGNVDVLVTEAGDLVEIEEAVAADKVPAGVRSAAEKEAGKDAKLEWEKKTVVMYEVHYKKDGKGHELVFTPDARPYHEEGEKKGEKDKDDDDDD